MPRPGMAAPRADSSALPLQLGGFRLAVGGPAAHESDDTWDASWLATTVRCEAPGAEVTVPLIVLTSWSVRRFSEGLEELMRSHQGCALLAAEGPELSVCVRPGIAPGYVSLRIDLTPDREHQGHWFSYQVESSQVPAAIAQCQAILGKFPPHEVAES